MKTKWIESDVFNFGFRVYLGTLDELNTKLKKKKFNQLNSSVDASVHHWEGERYMELYLTTTASPGIIAHESLHIALFAYGDIGATVDLHDHEPLAYLLQWIVYKITQFLDNEKKNNK